MWIIISVLVLLTSSYFLFRGSMNLLQAIGPLYWVTRDIGQKGQPVLSIGFMHETGYPWRRGRGIQIRTGKYVFQLGLCRTHKELGHEETSLITALDGRFLDTDPKTIRKWR